MSTVWTILLVVVIVAVISFFSPNRRRPQMKLPRPKVGDGWAKLKEQEAPWGKAAALFGAFAGLELALWLSEWAPGMFTWPGILQLPTYAFLLVVAVLVETYLSGKLLFAGRGLLFATFLIFGLSHVIKPCDQACQDDRAAAAVVEQHRLAQIQAAKLKAIEAASKPASTDKCPGTVPTHPIKFGTEWLLLQDGDCDLQYAITKGKDEVEFSGPDGTYNPAEDGPVTHRRLTKVHTTTGMAEMFYIVCPRGFGPNPGSKFICKPWGSSYAKRQVGVQLGFYYK